MLFVLHIELFFDAFSSSCIPVLSGALLKHWLLKIYMYTEEVPSTLHRMLFFFSYLTLALRRVRARFLRSDREARYSMSESFYTGIQDDYYCSRFCVLVKA